MKKLANDIHHLEVDIDDLDDTDADERAEKKGLSARLRLMRIELRYKQAYIKVEGGKLSGEENTTLVEEWNKELKIAEHELASVAPSGQEHLGKAGKRV